MFLGLAVGGFESRPFSGRLFNLQLNLQNIMFS